MKKSNPLVNILAIVIFLILMSMLLFPLIPIERPRRTQCLANIKQLAIAAIMYSDSNDQALPLCDNWYDSLVATYAQQKRNSDKPDFFCSEIPSRKPDQIGYAMYFKMSGRKVDSIVEPEQIVLVFESVILDKNASTGLVGFGNRHEPVAIGFADGHLKAFVKPNNAELDKVIKANLAMK